MYCYTSQRTVVHIHTTAEINFLYFKRVAAEQVIVNHSAKQIVCRGNRVQIARKVQIYIRHRHNLRISAARRAALYTENRPERGFAQGKADFFAELSHSVCKTDRYGSLTLSACGRVDCRN